MVTTNDCYDPQQKGRETNPYRFAPASFMAMVRAV